VAVARSIWFVPMQKAPIALISGRARRGRPIQRFPYLTVLKPGGDPANPADWQRGRTIDIDPALYRNWAGAEFFKPGFQRFCGFSGLQFVCQP